LPGLAARCRAAEPGEPAAPLSWRQDADLVDVFFVDRQLGWAVGERGVIWHTQNGGADWTLQESGVDCRLECVQFVDAGHGWIAGGGTHPGTDGSWGCLLSTFDGGRTWQRNRKALLPALRKVKFFDADHGWAVARPSALYPSGIVATEDGGRSWRALSGPDTGPVTAADFLDSMTGIASTVRGELLSVQGREVVGPTAGPPGVGRIRAVSISTGSDAWLAGGGGLIATTDDAGRSWRTPGPMPAGMAEEFDWRAVDAHGPFAWIAGSPGTRILHTRDGGQSWLVGSTGQALPLNAIRFLNPLEGWAAGSLGTILATQDGGRTWTRQRSGGMRSAMMTAFAEAADLPFETLARLSAGEGYLSVSLVLSHREGSPGSPLVENQEELAREACMACGTSSLEWLQEFPVASPEIARDVRTIVERWNQAHGGAGMLRAEEAIVRKLRTWRPDVVVTHAATPGAGPPLPQVTSQLVLTAVEKAADPKQYPNQLSAGGLEPWEVTKVFGVAPVGAHCDGLAAEFSPRLGSHSNDFALVPRLLVDGPHAGPSPRADGAPSDDRRLGRLRLYTNRLAGGEEGDVFAGIPLSPGSDARRRLDELPAATAGDVLELARKSRTVQAIVAQSAGRLGGLNALAGQLSDLTGGLSPAQAGDVLYRLGLAFQEKHQPFEASQAWGLLIDQYADHPMAPAALVWLIRHWSSGEIAWQARRSQAAVVEQASFIPGASSSDTRASREAAAGEVQSAVFDQGPAGTLPPPAGSAAEADRLAQAIRHGETCQRVCPLLTMEPSVGFPLTAAWRAAGQARSAERFLLSLGRGRPHDDWWACGQVERWLADRTGPCPKPTVRARRIYSKPRLDGLLDDEAWKSATPVPLTSEEGTRGQQPGLVLLSYDEEFLYVAVECAEAPGAERVDSEGPRPRDGDLSGRDRVELWIDVDRDWSTFYRLAVDERGWTGEDCADDTTWDPTWYVARARNEGTWTIEAAVPLFELTGQAPVPGTAWALGIRRTIPGVGFQNFSTSPVGHRPESFGLLTFE
jgi:photosystem II stability/assembly factor-like uncharacterized protein